MASESDVSTKQRVAAKVRGAAEPRTPSAPSVEEAIRKASLELFVERGFHGTSMRDIATHAGTNVSHLYYYFPSKAHVLRSMMLAIVDELLARLTQALDGARTTPADKLSAIVHAQVLFHSQRQAEAFIGRSELRSLTDFDRPDVLSRYDQVSAIFSKTIAEGVRSGDFHCAHVVEATSAIVTMCNGVSGWYQKERGLSPTLLAKRYAELALRMVGSDAIS